MTRRFISLLPFLTQVVALATVPAAAADPPGGVRLLAKLPGPAGTAAAFSRDGKLLITAGGDEARVWDAETFKPVTGPLKHEDGKMLLLARLSADGDFAMTASGGEARVWHVEGAERASVLRAGSTVHWAEFSPDGSKVITASDDGTAAVWDAATGEPLLRLQHPAAVKFADFTPDGSKLVTIVAGNAADADWILEHRAFRPTSFCTLRVWDYRTQRELFRRVDEPILNLEREHWVRPVSFSADGRLAASVYVWLGIVWDTASGRALCSIDARSEKLRWDLGWPQAMALSPDGSRFAACGGGAVGIWKVEDQAANADSPPARFIDGATSDPPLVRSLEVHGVEEAAFSADGRHILLLSNEEGSGVYHVDTGRHIVAFRASAAAFSPDGSCVAAAHTSDGFTSVWEVPDPKQP